MTAKIISKVQIWMTAYAPRMVIFEDSVERELDFWGQAGQYKLNFAGRFWGPTMWFGVQKRDLRSKNVILSKHLWFGDNKKRDGEVNKNAILDLKMWCWVQQLYFVILKSKNVVVRSKKRDCGLKNVIVRSPNMISVPKHDFVSKNNMLMSTNAISRSKHMIWGFKSVILTSRKMMLGPNHAFGESFC